MSKHMLLVK